jgi:hypothetical protein
MASFWDEILKGASNFGNYLTNTGSGGALEDVGSAFQNEDGSINFKNIASAGGGIASLLGSTGLIDANSGIGKFLGVGGTPQTGYLGEIPDYTASRMQVPGSYDPNRRPGSSGQRYFTDVDYSGGDTSGAAAALQKANLNNPARVNNSVGNAIAASAPAPQMLAQGGIAGLNMGGDPRMAQPMNNMTQPRYLQGPMDGMADTIPASIDGKDPAALSGGEFVVPADIVSGLGNGNSDAGAKNLYEMMDRIRQARTGMKKQPPPIDPNQMLPTARV